MRTLKRQSGPLCGELGLSLNFHLRGQFNKTSTLVTNNLGSCYYTLMQKLSPLNIVKSIEVVFLKFSLSFFMHARVKPKVELCKVQV